MSLHLDWCSSAAARYAVEHWHYSRSLPCPPRVHVGVWEHEKFIGAVVFGRGASTHLLKRYGLDITQGAELVRVALSKHEAPVSRIVSIAVKMLRKKDKGLRLLVSFADPTQGHVGGIYQALGWIYTGQSAPSKQFTDKAGRVWHERMVSERGWNWVFGEKRKVVKPSECETITLPGKHRYLLPLDDDMTKLIQPMRRPYPKLAS